MGAKTEQRRARRVGEFASEPAMIEMGVRDEDVRDALAIERVQQRVQMVVVIGPRINDGDVVVKP